MPVLTEEGGESDLGRKVSQPKGRGGREQHVWTLRRSRRLTAGAGLKGTGFGELQKPAEHVPPFVQRTLAFHGRIT